MLTYSYLGWKTHGYISAAVHLCKHILTMSRVLSQLTGCDLKQDSYINLCNRDLWVFFQDAKMPSRLPGLENLQTPWLGQSRQMEKMKKYTDVCTSNKSIPCVVCVHLANKGFCFFF